MRGVPVAPRRVFGVRFCASTEPGRDTWVCRAHPGSEGIRVESVARLADLPGGAADPAGACRALVGKILEAPRSAWGFDFAFGLPAAPLPETGGLAPGADTWQRGLTRLAECESPATLARDVGPGPRRTDGEADLPGPLAPDRIDATWLGCRGVLLPLRGHPVLALPMDPLPAVAEGMPPAMLAAVPSTYLLEVSGERLLERLDVDAPGVALHAGDEGRQHLLRAMVAAGWVRPMARTLRTTIVGAPGPLLAVANAVAAWRGYRESDHRSLCADPASGAEGHVYR